MSYSLLKLLKGVTLKPEPSALCEAKLRMLFEDGDLDGDKASSRANFSPSMGVLDRTV